MIFDDLEIKKEEIVEEKEKKLSLFDVLNSLYHSKDLKFNEIEKTYNPYMINKFVSMNSDLILVANEMNINPFLSKQVQFDFYTSIIRKKKRYTKYLKADKEEIIDIIKFYMKCSNEKAKDILRLLSEEQVTELKVRYKNEHI